MYHKTKEYRIHQKERIIEKRKKDYRAIYADNWYISHNLDIEDMYLSEPNRLNKCRPLGTCGNKHCSCCSTQSYYNEYKRSWRKKRDDIAAQAEWDGWGMDIPVDDSYDYC
jgi:hypothetical protein